MNSSLPYERTVLPNGVRLLLLPMEGVNSVATSVFVGVGSRYEVPAINGISHFLEHMVFKGTEKYPTTDDVNVIERQGGLQNAYTDIDVTNYHNKVLASDWELALDINKELALHPRLEQEHVDRERDVIIEEMKRYEDEPSAKVEEVFHQMLYPGTSLGMKIIGEEKSLRDSDSRTLRAYHDEWYQPNKIVVVLAGGVKHNESGMKNKVQEWFGSLTGTATGGMEIVTDQQDGPKVAVTTKPDASQAHMVLGLRTFGRTSEDRFAWNLFNLLFGVSFTSRLFKEIREKRGLCYHVRSSGSSYTDVGNWSIYAGVATDKVTEATKAIIEELAKAVDKGVTNEEIVVAKKRLKTMLAFKAEDPEFLNEYYGRQEVYGEPLMTLEEYLKKIEAVTKGAIDRLVKKYIVEKNLTMSVVWNKPKDERLLTLLKL